MHRAHLLAIPYENLDIHLGRPITLDPEAMFPSSSTTRRGGWCFEMNGVLGRVLETLGFDVRYLSGAVGRAEHGWRAQGNHLVLLVTLDRPWIVDVGFGDGFLDAAAARARAATGRTSCSTASRRDGPRWRVHNHEFGGADGFDFTLTPRTLDDFAAQCHELQTSPESSFVKSTVCERCVPTRPRHAARRHAARGDRRRRDDERECAMPPSTTGCCAIASTSPCPGSTALWPRVWARHLAWQAEQAQAGANRFLLCGASAPPHGGSEAALRAALRLFLKRCWNLSTSE